MNKSHRAGVEVVAASVRVAVTAVEMVLLGTGGRGCASTPIIIKKRVVSLKQQHFR